MTSHLKENNMKTQNEHLELIEKLEQKLNPEYMNNVFTWLTIKEALISIHSIASVEPEPLAKNKQTENDFYCWDEDRGEKRCSIKCNVCDCKTEH